MGHRWLVRLLIPAMALVVAACVSPGGGEPSVAASPTASSAVTPETPTGLSTESQLVSRDVDLPAHLVSVSPGPGASVGFDLGVCAVFDVSGENAGQWDGPVWIEMNGAEHRPFASVTTEEGGTTARHMCATLRELLESDEMEKAPPDGPLELGVRFEDPAGDGHSYSWTVDFKMARTPAAPAEVQRIREVYRLLETIDAGERGQDRTISGYFLRGEVLEIYLLDNADPEAVRAEVELVLGDKAPSGGIRLSSLDPLPEGQSVYQWISETREVVHGLSALPLHSMSGGCCNIWDRVSVDVGTVYAAHRIREALEETGVPQEAVFIEVSRRPILLEPSVGQRNVGITIELGRAARAGESMRVEVIWTNLGDTTVEFTYSPIVPLNLVVFAADGSLVWASHDGGPIFAIGATAELAPGEEKRFTYYWNLVDVDGFLVQPGEYVVQAQADVWSPSDSDRSMVSAAYPVTIEP